MYVVTVLFRIQPAHYPDFMRAMVENARISLQEEPGCQQFDVCERPAAECTVFLYECYDTEADFQAHLGSAHFLAFNEQVAPWVAEKSVAVYGRAWPGA